MSDVCVARSLGVVIDDVQLLADVSVGFKPGEVVALIGPNGAGKSTLLRTLSGEYSATSGEVFFHDRPVGDWDPAELANVRGVMSQAQELAFPFRVEEVIGLGIDGVAAKLRANERHSIVTYCAVLADVTHLFGRLYQTLSGGERQRVHFARVLAQLRAGQRNVAGQMLFLDEPVSSLDIAHQWTLMATVRDLAATGLAILVVLHDINLALTTADKVAVLSKGSLAAFGKPSEAISEDIISDVFAIRRRSAAETGSVLQIAPQLFEPRPAAERVSKAKLSDSSPVTPTELTG